MFVRVFKEIRKGDASLAGGKGASLGEMFQLDIPVPPGFVVLAAAFEAFLEKTDLGVEIEAILEAVDIQKMHAVEHASETIQKFILEAAMPREIAETIRNNFDLLESPFVAVRSSATAEDSNSAAWAGQLDTFLNTTEASLLENVQKCWASLFTPRAIFYRFEKGLHTSKISVAVVVQKMIQSEVSGIAFSVHPVTEDPNQLIIEAGLGLGEAIVSGQVTPDSYVVEKEPRKILDINVSEQTRGISRNTQGGNEWRELGEAGSRQKLTPSEILELSEIILTIERHYGFPCDIEWAREDGKFYIVQSRPITTLSSGKQVNVERNPLEDVSLWRFWGKWKVSVLGNAPYDLYAGTEIFRKLRAPSTFKGWAVSVSGYVYALEEDHRIFDRFVCDKFENDQTWFDYFFRLEEESVKRAQSLRPNKDIVACMKLFNDLGCLSMIIHFCDKGLQSVVSELAQSSGLASDEFTKLMVPYQSTYTMQYKTALKKVKQEQLSPEAVLEEFSWIGSGYVEGRRLTLADIREEIQKLEKEGETNSENLLTSLDETLQRKMLILQKLIYYRSINAELITKSLNGQREALEKLAGQHGLKLLELGALTPDEIIELAEQHVLPSNIQQRLPGGLEENGITYAKGQGKLYFGQDLERILRVFCPNVDKEQALLTGAVAFRGVVQGVVKIVENIDDLQKMQEGDIMVAPETIPDYIVGMKKAVAFVTDLGGITSHAAIVARELRKPCIIGTKIATQVLHDGDLVEVDAENGVVRIFKKNQIIDEPLFQADDYFHLGRWVAPTLSLVPWMRWADGQLFEDLGVFFEKRTNLHIDGHALYPVNFRDTLERVFLPDIQQKDPVLIQKYFTLAGAELDKFLASAETVKVFDEANATKKFQEFITAYEKIIPAWISSFFIGPVLEKHIQTVAKKYDLDSDEVLARVASHKKTFSQEARQELREIKKKIISHGLFEFIESNKPEALLQNNEIKHALFQYVEKWEWIETHHVSGDPLTLEKVLDELRDLKDAQSKEDISTYPEELQKLLEIAGDLAWLRLQSAETSALVSFATRPLIRFLGDKIGLSYDEVIWLTAEEIINHVETKTIADKLEVAERVKAWGGYRSADTVLKVLTGEELERVLGPLIPKHNLNVSELKGMIGYKGKVTGRARVMLTPRSDKAFVEGEILIASETTPDYLPNMKKALAFVTDQGGITSHAAIISRELQKPCIVGTKIATQVLHDGDLVEVDAEEGVVRILERAK